MTSSTDYEKDLFIAELSNTITLKFFFFSWRPLLISEVAGYFFFVIFLGLIVFIFLQISKLFYEFLSEVHLIMNIYRIFASICLSIYLVILL